MSTAASSTDPIRADDVALPTFEQLPNEVDTLKRMVIELVATLHRERLDKDALRQRIALLLTRLFGPRTERVNPDQLLLFADRVNELAANEQDAAPPPESTAPDDAEPPPKKKRCKPHGRGRLAEDLPRRPLHHELSAAERICVCGHPRIDIGTDMSEQLDWQPASLFVWQHWIHKYACPHCRGKSAEDLMTQPPPAPEDTSIANAISANAISADAIAITSATNAAPAIGRAVISAAKPALPIAKGLPGPGLLAQVIVSKYFDHLPLYRQQSIFARQGVSIARSTLCDWMAASADVLRPLYDRMVSLVLQSAWLHTDDTPVKNLGHEPGTTALSRLWIYWGDRAHPCNVFDFTINHKRDGPQKFLAGFRGYLHADAFSGYDALYLPGPRGAAAPILEVACNAHARRKFHEARGSDVVRAHLALAYYRQLYRLERGATDAQLDDAGRLQMRQDLSKPILEKFHAWLVEQRPHVLPKSPMAEAIGYALNNWTALVRYTEAGFLSIDNNVAEREMKRIAIGRKNWLFVGSDKGGRTASVLFSFTSTCHRLKIDPWAYLRDVLTRLPGLPSDRLAELLPERWQASRPQAATSGAEAPAVASPPPPSAT